MSKEIKMSDYFKEQVTLCGDTIEDSKFAYAVMSCEYIVNGVDAGLAICHAINNHDRLVEENKRLREALEVAKAEVKKISNSIDALDVWIDNESSCAEWVSIDVIRSRLGKMYGRALRLLSELGGE